MGEVMQDFVKKTLASGKVVPGFGHAVLRKPDPRYMSEREFALKNCQDDPLFHLVDACYQAIPEVLEATGKVKNPFPNVDAHSGQLMYYYNLKEQNYYTVVFAVSRTIGCVSQLVWSRAMGLPIERPKSVPLDTLKELAVAGLVDHSPTCPAAPLAQEAPVAKEMKRRAKRPRGKAVKKGATAKQVSTGKALRAVPVRILVETADNAKALGAGSPSPLGSGTWSFMSDMRNLESGGDDPKCWKKYDS